MASTTARDRTITPDLRVSDAERDTVADELARHLQDGRLDAAEFDERLSQAMTARTRGDLARLLTDLPRAAPDQPPAGRSPRWPAAAWAFPLVLVAMVVAFIALAGPVGQHGWHGHPFWALWWLVWLVPAVMFTARRRLRGMRR
jgi:hypothetical protein